MQPEPLLPSAATLPPIPADTVEQLLCIAEATAEGAAYEAFWAVNADILRGGPIDDVKMNAVRIVTSAARDMAMTADVAADAVAWSDVERDELHRRQKAAFDRRLNEMAATEWQQPEGPNHAAE